MVNYFLWDGGGGGFAPLPPGGGIMIPGPPPAPPSITIPATAIAGGAATISWGASTGSTSYRLERNINGTTTWTQIFNGATRSFTDTVPANATTVSWRVLAQNHFGAGGWRTSAVRNVLRSPTVPPSITIPATVLAGGAATISWQAAQDQNTPPQTLTYILERSINSTNWTQVFHGAALNFTDAIPANATTAQWRVIARNVSGISSGWRNSVVRNIITNRPPTIDGNDDYLGEKPGAFTYDYIVTDPDPEDTITVTEQLNGALIRQYIAESGAEQTLSVSADQFVRLGNERHTLTITATDQWGASYTRTKTFSRAETQIDVSLETPLEASDMPARIVVNVDRQIPEGATFQVLVCNNGYDTEPVWEDCTNRVIMGLLHHFTNTKKTAAEWGVNVRVLINRNSATEPCYILGIGGNFDGGTA